MLFEHCRYEESAMPSSVYAKCPCCGELIDKSDNPSFCTDCGIRFVRSCANCDSPLELMSRFCGQCGHLLYAKLADQTIRAIISTAANANITDQAQRAELEVANRQMITQLRTDNHDATPVIGETLRVMVRLNPVNVMLHNFWSFINSITDNTPPSEIANIVGQAIDQIDLSNALADLDGSHELITAFTRDIVLNVPRTLIDVWPSYQDFVPKHSWLANPESEAEVAAEQIRRALSMNRSDLAVIQKHFQQLREFYPRYSSIMTRTGVMDYVLGMAAGLFGGFLGVVGAQVWDDWRSQADREFVQSFSNAVDQFSNSSLAFTQNTENAVNSVVDQLLRTYTDLGERVVVGLETAACNGLNINIVYKTFHDPDQPITDQNSIQLCEIVFDNLRQQGYSGNSESNMRHVSGLSARGSAVATKYGECSNPDTSEGKQLLELPPPQPSVAQLPQTLPEQHTHSNRTAMMEILHKNFGGMTNRFYFAPNIPTRKLSNTRTQYAFFLRPGDEILLLYDATVFGGAREGFVITDSGIGYKSNAEGEEAGFKTFEEIKSEDIHLDGSSLSLSPIDHWYVISSDMEKIAAAFKTALLDVRSLKRE